MKSSAIKLAVAGAVALASVTPAMAKPSHGPGGTHAPSGLHGGGKSKVHNVTYVFKGTWDATAGAVVVTHGNAHVRKAGLVGQSVQFDLTGAKLVVADTNADGSVTVDDLKTGDNVVVKARLPRKDPGTQPFKAKMLIDQSNPPTQSGGGAD
jgi:hypothetical protein